MDKAEVVFQKHAGMWSKFLKVFKKTPKLPRYEGLVTVKTPKLKKINKIIGKSETGAAQRTRERLYSSLTTPPAGTIPVSKPWTAEDKVKGLAQAKMFKQLGLK